MKILILGKGFIGTQLQQYLSCDISDTHIYSTEDVISEIEKYTPDVLINCIGRVGKENIDWCENNQYDTMFGNVYVPSMIKDACDAKNIRMVNIGSGCIYDGGEFCETDPPNFKASVYSSSKIICEGVLGEEVLQLRIRMPICGFSHPRNFLNKIIKYDELINVKNSVTVMPDFLFAVKKLIEKQATGIFNVVNPVPISHKEIIDIYNEYANKKKEFNLISVNQLERRTIAPRSNCRLSTDKLRKFGIVLEDSHIAIRKCIQEFVKEENLCRV